MFLIVPKVMQSSSFMIFFFLIILLQGSQYANAAFDLHRARCDPRGFTGYPNGFREAMLRSLAWGGLHMDSRSLPTMFSAFSSMLYYFSHESGKSGADAFASMFQEQYLSLEHNLIPNAGQGPLWRRAAWALGVSLAASPHAGLLSLYAAHGAARISVFTI